MKKSQAIKTEARNFRMDPNLLWSVIKSQAGTLEKALLEAVMNAVDAGASSCAITLDREKYKVTDDGKGFVSRREIEEFFETFGTPHSDGDSVYGRFRMGRGQLFSFSRTVWTSGEFRMDVDIKERGLSYDLEEGHAPVKGCQIEGFLYTPLTVSDLVTIAQSMKDYVRYMQIPVTFNGTRINKDLSDTKWTEETDDACLLIKPSGGLTVYNLGALVRVYPAHTFGVSGTIVSKKPLAVNFARTDILTAECAVWKRIRASVKPYVGAITRKKSITESERETLGRAALRGELSLSELLNAKLLMTVFGKNISLGDIVGWETVTLAETEADYVKGEKLANLKVAVVLRPTTLTRFGVDTIEELWSSLHKVLNRLLGKLFVGMPVYTPFRDLAHLVKQSYDAVEEKTLTKPQKTLLIGLYWASRTVAASMNLPARLIHAGKSDVASAWTDGSNYICFNVEVLSAVLSGKRSLSYLLSLLAHEYCHGASDEGGHGHTPEFYETFHNLYLEQDVAFAPMEIARGELLSRYVREAMRAGIKPAQGIRMALKRENDLLDIESIA